MLEIMDHHSGPITDEDGRNPSGSSRLIGNHPDLVPPDLKALARLAGEEF